jgi:hypothetical protein
MVVNTESYIGLSPGCKRVMRRGLSGSSLFIRGYQAPDWNLCPGTGWLRIALTHKNPTNTNVYYNT